MIFLSKIDINRNFWVVDNFPELSQNDGINVRKWKLLFVSKGDTLFFSPKSHIIRNLK